MWKEKLMKGMEREQAVGGVLHSLVVLLSRVREEWFPSLF